MHGVWRPVPAGEGKPRRAGEEVRRPDRGAELHPEGGRFRRWAALLPFKRSSGLWRWWRPRSFLNGRGFPLFRFARERRHRPTSVGPPGVAGATQLLLLARSACALSRPSFPLLFSRRPRYLYPPLLARPAHACMSHVAWICCITSHYPAKQPI